MAPKQRKKNRHRSNQAEPENKAAEQPAELEGTGRPTLTLPSARGEPPLREGNDDSGSESDYIEDPEQRAQHERKKRIDLEEYYHEELAQRDARIDTLEKQMAEVMDVSKRNNKELAEYIKKSHELEKNLETTEKKLKEATQQRDWHAHLAKNHNKIVEQKDKEYKEMQNKKAEEFRAKKGVQQELAEARATCQALHQSIDKLENEKAEKDKEVAAAVAEIHAIHGKLEASFTEIPAGAIPTPELVDKVTEQIAELRKGSLQRGGSRTSMHSDQSKKARQSLGDELGLGDGEVLEDQEEEDDITLTVDAELAEMKQKVEGLELDLESEKAKGEFYLRKIAAGNETLAQLHKELDQRKAAEKPLGFATIVGVGTEPISPSFPSPPGPLKPDVVYETKTVTRELTVIDYWNAVPNWVVVLVLSLLVLFFAFCAYAWYSATTERDLWLGANDIVRAGAVRLANNRKEAYCGRPPSPLEGTLAPLWRWLEMPAPVMLT